MARIVMKKVSGPTSYTPATTTAGWDVAIGEFEKIKHAIVQALGGGEYLAQVYSYAGTTGDEASNEVRIKVRNNIEQAVDEGGTATYTIGGEVASGTDLSGVEFLIIAEGY